MGEVHRTGWRSSINWPAAPWFHLRRQDLAWTALRSALDIAESGEDRVRAATLRGTVAWLLVARGRFAESRAVGGAPPSRWSRSGTCTRRT
jgi:hypothetical protein